MFNALNCTVGSLWWACQFRVRANDHLTSVETGLNELGGEKNTLFSVFVGDGLLCW